MRNKNKIQNPNWKSLIKQENNKSNKNNILCDARNHFKVFPTLCDASRLTQSSQNKIGGIS
jgi:hypothetical protein